MPTLAAEFTDGSLSLQANAEGGSSVSNVNWDAIYGFEEDDQVFFFLTKGSMLYLPKRDIPIDLLPTIRQIAQEKVKPKKC